MVPVGLSAQAAGRRQVGRLGRAGPGTPDPGADPRLDASPLSIRLLSMSLQGWVPVQIKDAFCVDLLE